MNMQGNYNKSINKMERLKDILIVFVGFILYLNYRIIYAFFVHKTVSNFNKFAMSKDDDNSLPVIFAIDLVAVSWYFFGFKWMVITVTAVSLLNLIVLGVYHLYKKLRK